VKSYFGCSTAQSVSGVLESDVKTLPEGSIRNWHSASILTGTTDLFAVPTNVALSMN
jgi:hypothetical protein